MGGIAPTRSKARGTKLGNPHGAAALRRAGKGNTASLRVIKEKASQHAENLRPVVEALRSDGVTGLGGIAQQLNERGMLTPRGGRWHKSSVRNLRIIPSLTVEVVSARWIGYRNDTNQDRFLNYLRKAGLPE